MNKATFTGRVKAVADETHPLQQKLQFVFTDFQPNSNKQGVSADEADNIILSAVNMPVKINYKGKPMGHLGATPIGPITSVYLDEDRLLAEAIVWKDEFKDVSDFLAKSSAEEGGAQFSWELYYSDSELIDDVQWLHGCLVAGTTIVDVPAYHGRTPLLAVSEEIMDLEKQIAELTRQIEELRKSESEKEKTIAELQTALSEAQVAVSGKDELEKQIAELNAFKEKVEAEEARRVALAARKEAIAKANIDISEEAFEQRAETFLAMSDEVFEAYIQDMSAMAAKSRASASASDRVTFPDPVSRTDSGIVTMKDLAKAIRSRGN